MLVCRIFKRNERWLLLFPKDNKVFVSTNARFLEDDHIRNHKSNNKFVLEELDTDEIGNPTKDQTDEIIVDQPVISVRPHK